MESAVTYTMVCAVRTIAWASRDLALGSTPTDVTATHSTAALTMYITFKVTPSASITTITFTEATVHRTLESMHSIADLFASFSHPARGTVLAFGRGKCIVTNTFTIAIWRTGAVGYITSICPRVNVSVTVRLPSPTVVTCTLVHDTITVTISRAISEVARTTRNIADTTSPAGMTDTSVVDDGTVE